MSKKFNFCKKIKKVFAAALSLFCSLSIFDSLIYVSAQEIEYPIAELKLNHSMETKNITRFGWGDVGDFGTRLVRKGIECIRLNKEDSKTLYIYVDVDDKVIYKPEDSMVGVEVDYFDEGYGKFTITYDGLTSKSGFVDGEIVQLENTGEWRTHTFYLYDAVFANGFNAGNAWDFRIGEWSELMGMTSEDVILGGIRVSQGYYEHEVNVKPTTKHTGNIFDAEDEKIFNLAFKNNTNILQNTVVEYFITDIDDNILEQGEVKTTVNSKGKDEKDIVFKPLKNGVYVLNLKVTTVGNNDIPITYEVKQDFSVMDKFKDGEKLNYTFGASGHTSWGYDVNKSMELITAAGLGAWRDEYSWSAVEYPKGDYHIAQPYDYNYSVMVESGVYPMVIAAYGNGLYDEDVSVPRTEEGIYAYAQYAAFLAKTGKMKAIEIWNEFNIKPFNPEMLEAEHYVKMLKACYTEIKKVNPEIKVIGVVSAGMDKEYMKKIFDAGGYNYLDVVSMHPYDVYRRRYFDDQGWAKQVLEVKELMKQYGEYKELWYTEMGWPTHKPESFTDMLPYTEEQQAQYIPRMYITSRVNEVGEKIFIYDLEEDGTSVGEAEHNFGIVASEYNVRTPMAAKPAYISICAMNKQIGNSEYKDSVYFNETTSAHCFINKDNNEQVIAIWSALEDSVALNLGIDEITLIDVYGNIAGTMKSANGVYQFDINDEIYYIKGNFRNFEACDTDFVVEYQNEVIKGNTFDIKISDKKKRNLKIDIVCDDAFKVEKNDGVVNGEGTVLIKTISEDDKTHNIIVKIYDGENGVAYLDYKVTIGAQMVCELSMEASEATPKRQRIINRLTNKTDNETISGTCKIIAPKELAETTTKESFLNVRPGDTVNVPINLPEQLTSRSWNVTVRYELSDGTVWEEEGRINETVAKKVKNVPLIDGNLIATEWKGNMFEAKSDFEAVSLNGTWDGPEDLSITGRVMYDDKNLYLGLNVKDNAFVQEQTGENIWNGDCIQIGIEDFSPVEKEANSSKFTEIGIALTKEGPTVWRYNSCYDLPNGEVKNAEVAIKRNGTSTVYEIKLPFAEIFREAYNVVKDKTMGFSIIVNDADDKERKSAIEYNSGIGTGKDSKLFGSLKFAD